VNIRQLMRYAYFIALPLACDGVSPHLCVLGFSDVAVAAELYILAQRCWDAKLRAAAGCSLLPFVAYCNIHKHTCLLPAPSPVVCLQLLLILSVGVVRPQAPGPSIRLHFEQSAPRRTGRDPRTCTCFRPLARYNCSGGCGLSKRLLPAVRLISGFNGVNSSVWRPAPALFPSPGSPMTADRGCLFCCFYWRAATLNRFWAA